MSPMSFDVFNLFVAPPGDFLYYLIVIISSQIGLFMLLSTSAIGSGGFAIRRYRVALLGVVAAWLLLLLGGLVSILAQQPPNLILPTLERAVTALSVLFVGWAFITSDAEHWRRPANIVLGTLTSLILLGYALTTLDWLRIASIADFNLTGYGVGWAFVAAVLSMLGILLVVVLIQDVVDAPLKLTYFVIMFLGHAVTLFQTVQGDLIGDYAGAARLSFATGSVIVAILVFRLVIRQLQATNTPDLANQQAAAARNLPPIPLPPEPRSSSDSSFAPRQPATEAQLLKALGMILDAPTPDQIPQQVVLAALDLLKADIGALLRIQDANYADFTVAHDAITYNPLPPTALNLNDHPTLVNAMERRTQRALYTDRNLEELHDIYTRLNIEQIGPIYFQPMTRNSQLLGILLIALPYSNRELSRTEGELLTGIGILAGSLLTLAYNAEDANTLAEDRILQTLVEGGALAGEDSSTNASRQQIERELRQARDEILSLNQQVGELQTKLDTERNRLTALLDDTQENLSISQGIRAVTEEQQRLRTERDMLQQRLQDAEATFNSATATNNSTVMRNLLQALRDERDKLLVERTHLQQQLDDFRAQDRQVLPGDMQQLLNRMIEEKTRLEVERNQLSDKLTHLLAQLADLGIEDGTAGLAQLIGRLYEEKAQLNQQVHRLEAERTTLLNERMKLADAITREAERSERLERLENDLAHLSADREAAFKQRDRLRQQLQATEQTLDRVKAQRARLLAQVAGYELEREEAREAQLGESAPRSAEPTTQPTTDAPYQPSRPDLLIGLVQELRTPMTSVSGYVDLLLKETPGILGEMQRKFLQRVASNINRLEMMINDLVQVAALDAGQHALQPRPVDVVALIEEAITNASIQFREKGLTVQLNLAEALPDLPADVDAVNQIIQQLLLNAYLASPPDTQVSVHASQNTFDLNGAASKIPCIYLTVSDSGGGIQQEDIPRVFARKYKADNPLIDGLGDTGVGLSIAQALVRAHGGQLWVETERGVGSTFHVALPLKTPLQAAHQTDERIEEQ